MNIYRFTARRIDGKEQTLADYKGYVLLIVNTASECGFTPQLNGLQKLYDQYKELGFAVLGFPCNQFNNQDPGSDAEIADFCQSQYNVTFPMFSKVNVKGENAHPLFKYLTQQAKGIVTKQIKWNFTKFLVDQNGHVIKRFAPQTKPETIARAVENTLTS